MAAFDILATYYDELVGAEYPQIAEHIFSLLGEGKKTGVDLGCGSGTLCFLLEEKGCDMVGIDLSEEMLSIALSKKPRNSRVVFSKQDISDFALPDPVDFIVSTLDCVNYFQSFSELEGFVQCCYENLKPDGLLIFDVNSFYKYESVLGDNVFVYENDDVYMVWDNLFEEDIMNILLTFFVKEGEHYKRYEEEQIQSYFDKEDILHLLKCNGFLLQCVTDDYSTKEPDEHTERYVFVTRKRS